MGWHYPPNQTKKGLALASWLGIPITILVRPLNQAHPRFVWVKLVYVWPSLEKNMLTSKKPIGFIRLVKIYIFILHIFNILDINIFFYILGQTSKGLTQAKLEFQMFWNRWTTRLKDQTCGSLLTHYHDLQVYGTKVELRFACEKKTGIMCKMLKRHYYLHNKNE